ncbi:MAG: DUF6504 family protein [Chthoniobacteraceae bacterium]|nr:DUF6504 family protein [Chthoniobacteraceae bacterium]
MRERLISEAVTPVADGGIARPVVIGAPLLPARFRWRGEEYAVAEVIAEWKETGPCRHGSGERYVRKHWFHIRTAAGEEWKLYFERQARSARERKARWWLFTAAP